MCMSEIVKVCKVHGELTVEQVQPTYNPARNNRYPYSHAHCRQCRNAKQRIWAKNQPQNMRDNNLYTRFKIRRHEYDNMVSEQGNKCAICYKRETYINKKLNAINPLSIDHNHKTGKVRELLCQKCNTLLGMAKESIDTLKSAIEYLRRHE